MQLGKWNMTESQTCQNFNLVEQFHETFPKGDFLAKK